MLKEAQSKSWEIILLLGFILCFVVFRFYFANNLILAGDELTYHTMVLDTLEHQTQRFIDPSEFPGTKFNPSVYLMVPVVSVISTITKVVPFYVLKFFLPTILFVLSFTFFYIFCSKTIGNKYLAILLGVLFLAGATYKVGNYSLDKWFMYIVPQHISYVYFFIINLLIFTPGFLKKKFSRYDIVIILLLLSWWKLHPTHLAFGLTYYLFIFLFRANFFYPQKCLFLWKRYKRFSPLVVLALGFAGFKFFSTLKAMLDVGLQDGVKISYGFMVGTVGKYLFAIFLLLMAYRLLKTNKKNLSESLLFLLLGFFFIFLIFLNPIYLHWIPINNLYYRFIGYFIAFLYLSLAIFIGIIFKSNKKFSLVLVLFLLFLNFPLLKPFDIYAQLEYDQVVIGKERELFEIMKKLPRNSVFIESPVSPYLMLSAGFPGAVVPCWMDYLNNQNIKETKEKFKQLEDKRYMVYSTSSEKYFYDNVVEAIEKCYKYQIKPGVSYKKQSDLFYNKIIPFKEIPYNFYYIQSRKRLEPYYVEQYKTNRYPISELELIKYTFFPKIKGQYFKEYYQNDEFTIWELKKNL